MKKYAKKSLSLILAVLLLFTVVLPGSQVQAAAYTGIMRQTEPQYLNYWYGSDTLYASGCGLFSLCNAVGYLTGNKMDVVELANWAYANGYYSGATGTYRNPFYRKASARYGSTYGFTIDCNDGGGYWGTVYDSRLINHLANGGTAVIHVYGHFMALVGYDYSSGLYHLYDCAPAGKRNTTANGGDLWVTAAHLSSGYTNVDWYCLVYPTVAKNIDTQKPVISNVQYTNISSSGYTVTCTVTDNAGVQKVAFPSWTLANGQDDLPSNWMNSMLGTKSGNTYSFRVNTSSHNYESGYYVTHVYAVDTSGNTTSYALGNLEIRNDKTSPVISDVQVSNISSSGYTVSCTVTDDWGITNVAFPTWTVANGQDDLAADFFNTQQGTKSGNRYTFRVNASAHNYEKGQYVTHIYATDRAGNRTCVAVNTVEVMDDTTSPVISNVKVSDVSASGYTVTCTVSDNVNVDRVAFPSWTLANNQDDLDSNWLNTQLGTKNGNTYTFRVNASAHNYEEGYYTTHIYAIDDAGNMTTCSVGNVEVCKDKQGPVISDVRISDMSASGYTVTCTVTDNGSVQSVAFPTWTTANGQDDLAAYFLSTQLGTKNGNTYTFRVNTSAHNYETGNYATHIYATDNDGNRVCYEVNNIKVCNDTTNPVISNVKVTDVSSSGYTVTCTVTDNSWVQKVAFATWTNANDQDDLDPNFLNNQLGTRNGNTFTFRVNTSAHNNETGKYTTHIYAVDASGNMVGYALDTIIVG